MTSKPKPSTKEVDNDNVLFKKLRKLINLVDQLRDAGVNEYIQLPRIVSLGTQSSGKSSVLESIVGLDFLPRGDGVVTRRPLELRLNHIKDGKPWAFFDEVKGEKFYDFNKVRETIEKLTDDVCAGEKNIVDKPIVRLQSNMSRFDFDRFTRYNKSPCGKATEKYRRNNKENGYQILRRSYDYNVMCNCGK